LSTSVIAVCLFHQSSFALATGTWTRLSSDGPNMPIGVAKGIFPGRVVMARDSTAITFNGSGNWWDPQYNNQALIDSMLIKDLKSLSGKSAMTEVWDTLFRFYNQKHNKTSGYVKGEKIAIKVNQNQLRWDPNSLNGSPELILSLLKQLINVVGVAQSDIFVYDAGRPDASDIQYIKDYCNSFPNVNFNNIGGFTNDLVQYSPNSVTSITSENFKRLSNCVVNAAYIISMPLLKRHCEPSDDWSTNNGNASVSMVFKSHVGDFNEPYLDSTIESFHEGFRDWKRSGPSYNLLVDLESNPNLGGKTFLYILDGLYSGNRYDSHPIQWALFGNKYPAMILASQDPVALESVGIDFMYAEWKDFGDNNFALVSNADNHLHEAALIGNPPSGTNYVQKSLVSLGAHEHWNNSKDKKYSRNLGTGNGIEFVQVNQKVIVNVAVPNKTATMPNEISVRKTAAGFVLAVPHAVDGLVITVADIQGKILSRKSVSAMGAGLVPLTVKSSGALIISVECNGNKVITQKVVAVNR
jgi:hypothetical protein